MFTIFDNCDKIIIDLEKCQGTRSDLNPRPFGLQQSDLAHSPMKDCLWRLDGCILYFLGNNQADCILFYIELHIEHYWRILILKCLCSWFVEFLVVLIQTVIILKCNEELKSEKLGTEWGLNPGSSG